MFFRSLSITLFVLSLFSAAEARQRCPEEIALLGSDREASFWPKDGLYFGPHLNFPSPDREASESQIHTINQHLRIQDSPNEIRDSRVWLLGQGANGRAYLVQPNSDGAPYALKWHFFPSGRFPSHDQGEVEFEKYRVAREIVEFSARAGNAEQFHVAGAILISPSLFEVGYKFGPTVEAALTDENGSDELKRIIIEKYNLRLRNYHFRFQDIATNIEVTNSLRTQMPSRFEKVKALSGRVSFQTPGFTVDQYKGRGMLSITPKNIIINPLTLEMTLIDPY